MDKLIEINSDLFLNIFENIIFYWIFIELFFFYKTNITLNENLIISKVIFKFQIRVDLVVIENT